MIEFYGKNNSEVDENLIKEVVKALAILKEVNERLKLIEKYLENLGFLKIQEESLKKFLEKEPELYTPKDTKEKHEREGSFNLFSVY